MSSIVTEAKASLGTEQEVQLMKQTQHITVCVCTFKRPELLSRLFSALTKQVTDGSFTYSVVVADNDQLRSAERIVAEFSSRSSFQVKYCVEPQENIALARNRALQEATGDFVAFIDDDEFPADDWLLSLLRACQSNEADGVLGPVVSYFDTDPPRWITKGRFFDKRKTYPSGTVVPWPETRTGNVLFRRDVLDEIDVAFRVQFDTAGEDIDFFRRLIEKGRKFIWSNEAVVYEVVPQARCSRKYLLKRALLRGSNFPKHPKHRVRNILKSLIAVPCYTLALPILFFLGQHIFMSYLEKLLDHSSRLLAFAGMPLVKERQG